MAAPYFITCISHRLFISIVFDAVPVGGPEEKTLGDGMWPSFGQPVSPLCVVQTPIFSFPNPFFFPSPLFSLFSLQ